MRTVVHFAAPSGSRKPIPTRPSTRRDLSVDQLRALARFGVAVAVLAPPAFVERGPVLCLFRRATGHSCPSCGMTRSWNAVAHGRVGDGFQRHPLGPPAFVLAALIAVVPRSWLDRAPIASPNLATAAAATWIGVWFIRLLRGAPESA